MQTYLISVIITIYNAEEYLVDAIESVINQTIGFDKIQLILINNGSEDSSGDICRKYKERYPDNIDYVELAENIGPSGGRNVGIPLIKGDYFNFLDADDIWGANAFEKAIAFMQENAGKVSLVSCRREHFGREHSFHHVDYKFEDENRIVNIFDDYKDIQLHVTSCIYDSKECGALSFDNKINFGEDQAYIAQQIIKKGGYGLLSKDVVYYYRKREDNNSALDKKNTSRQYFLSDFENILATITDASLSCYGEVVPYAQYHMSYEIGWMLRNKCSILDEDDLGYVRSVVKKYLPYLDDKIIQESFVINKRELRAFALKLKDGRKADEMSLRELRKLKLFNINSDSNLLVTNICVDDNAVQINVLTSIFPNRERWEIYLKTKEDRLIYPCREGGNRYTYSLGEAVFCKYGFGWSIPIDEIDFPKMHFVLKLDGKEHMMAFRTGRWAKLNIMYSNSYYYNKVADGSLTIRQKKNQLFFYRNRNKFYFEIRYIKQLLADGELKTCAYRLLAFFAEKWSKKKTLLVCDRIHKAKDNGEYFLEWLNESEYKSKYRMYYIVSKDNPDIACLKKSSKVVYYASLKHKLLYMISSGLITSMIDDFILNPPFDREAYFLKDKICKVFYLGHGTTEQDMSFGEGLNRKNYRLLFVSGERELRSRLLPQSGYTENEVRLTGVPRLDRIYKARDKEKRKGLLIAPTWRKNIAGSYHMGKRMYNKAFQDSEYYQFFNRLINDSRLLDCLRRNDYKCTFNVHPVFDENASDFCGNDLIEVRCGLDDYFAQFYENKILLTDYSSLGHEHAYAGNYVIYSQFDEDEFYKGHTYSKGDFDYTTTGFGPVYYDYETTLQGVIKAIENDGAVEKKYKDRAATYFSYHDDCSCSRIMKEIEKLI